MTCLALQSHTVVWDETLTCTSGSRLLVLLKLSQLRLPLLPPPLLLLLLLLGQVQVQVPVPVLEVVRVEQVQMAVGGDEWRQERVL